MSDHDQPAAAPDSDDAVDTVEVAAPGAAPDAPVAPVEADAVAGPAAPSWRRGSTVTAAVLAALVAGTAVAALFLLGIVAAPPRDGDVPVDDLIEISDVAARFAAGLLTYDASDLGASRAALVDVATADFLELYEQTFAEGLAGSIGESGGSATATVREVFVGPVVGDDASAVVVVDAVVDSDSGTRTLTGVYLRMDLLRGEATGWRVDELTTLTAEDVQVS